MKERGNFIQEFWWDLYLILVYNFWDNCKLMYGITIYIPGDLRQAGMMSCSHIAKYVGFFIIQALSNILPERQDMNEREVLKFDKPLYVKLWPYLMIRQSK